MDFAIGFGLGVVVGAGFVLLCVVYAAGENSMRKLAKPPEIPPPPSYLSSHSTTRLRTWMVEFEAAWRRSAEEFKNSDPEKARNAELRRDTMRMAIEAFDRIALGML